MNLKEVMYGFFLLLALTTNFSLFYSFNGSFSFLSSIYLGITIFFNLIVILKKIGDYHYLGGVFLSTSLVAFIQLFLAGLIAMAGFYDETFYQEGSTLAISFCGGALIANGLSVLMYVFYTIQYKAYK